jgi:hypothetical protein
MKSEELGGAYRLTRLWNGDDSDYHLCNQPDTSSADNLTMVVQITSRASQDGIIGEVKSYASRLASEKRKKNMITTFRLYDGRKMTVETTGTGYTAQNEGESEKKRISSQEYMHLVLTANIC